MRTNNLPYFEGSLVGACVGEAMGATVEFMTPEQIKAKYGVLKDIIGGGAFGWEEGEATDDIDMLFAVGDSLAEQGKFVPEDVAQRLVKWFLLGPKDIGGTTRIALHRLATGVAWDKAAETGERSSGNGAIVRSTPIVIDYLKKKEPLSKIAEASDACSRITHGSEHARWAAVCFSAILNEVFTGRDLSEAWKRATHIANEFIGITLDFVPKDKPTGYAIDTLATAVNCCLQTHNFEDAIVRAVNLGDDADSVAAVAGAIAGAMYGIQNIPDRWTSKIKKSSLDFCKKFVIMGQE